MLAQRTFIKLSLVTTTRQIISSPFHTVRIRQFLDARSRLIFNHVISISQVLTATTFYLNIAMNADGADVNSIPPFMMKVFKLMPLFMVPAMVQFPAVSQTYSHHYTHSDL